jgi:hypothetical protein
MSRTAKRMIAYPAGPAPFEWQTASDKYTHAGLVWQQDGSWQLVTQGWSPESVEKRTKTVAGQQYVGNPQAVVNSMVSVVRAWEMTAPIVAAYFTHHRLLVTAARREGDGWVSVRWHAGRSNLRKMQKEGWTALQFQGRRNGGGAVVTADFQMSEIIRSLNSRKASV